MMRVISGPLANSAGYLCLCAAVLAAGCSGGAAERPELAPVGGTVVYKNLPVEGAKVAFWAEGAPRAAEGTTDSEGKFQLSTFDLNDGAVLGDHTATVVKMEAGATTGGTDLTALDDPAAMAEMAQQTTTAEQTGPKHLLPEKYMSPKTSDLKYTVTREGPNQFILTLVD
ncbi:MAG TPA: hypothetical protein VML55_01390 [Planctomycetaceae bacterium]|nr:hypothetical protein [Planctomycetaceae bacterium]